MKQNNIKFYMWLFRATFLISAFSFGGGYVVIPMIRKKYVDEHHCFTEAQLMEMAAIAQSSPGAIAVNLCVLSGYRCARLKGALICAIASVLPPLIILSILSLGYQAFRDHVYVASILKGMQAGVAALIVDLVIDMAQVITKEQPKSVTLLMPFTFICSFFLQLNVALILSLCILFCILLAYRKRRNFV